MRSGDTGHWALSGAMKIVLSRRKSGGLQGRNTGCTAGRLSTDWLVVNRLWSDTHCGAGSGDRVVRMG